MPYFLSLLLVIVCAASWSDSYLPALVALRTPALQTAQPSTQITPTPVRVQQCADNLQLSLSVAPMAAVKGDAVTITLALANRRLAGVQQVAATLDLPSTLVVAQVFAPQATVTQTMQALEVRTPTLEPGGALLLIVQGTATGPLTPVTARYTTLNGRDCRAMITTAAGRAVSQLDTTGRSTHTTPWLVFAASGLLALGALLRRQSLNSRQS